VVGVVGRVTKAEPAELIAADDASHMVASFVLLDFCPANRTEPDSTMLVSPSFKLAVHVLLTASPTMPLVTALEAYLSGALRAYNLLSVEGLTTHKSWTARFRAPTYQGISFLLMLLYEISKLLKSLGFLLLEKFCQLRHLDLGLALVLKADELFNVERGDFNAHILTGAVNAESVSA
jgi:hypothetical protein